MRSRFLTMGVGLLLAAGASADHEWNAQGQSARTEASNGPDYVSALAEAQKAAAYLTRQGLLGQPSLLQSKCLQCHTTEPNRTHHYTTKVDGVGLPTVNVTVDFQELNRTISAWLSDLEGSLPNPAPERRLDKETMYRWLTFFDRTKLWLSDTQAEVDAVNAIKRLFLASTGISNSVLENYTRYKISRGDIALRKRVVDVFGARGNFGGPSPEQTKKEFVNLGEAVGVGRSTMAEWIRLAPVTEMTAPER